MAAGKRKAKSTGGKGGGGGGEFNKTRLFRKELTKSDVSRPFYLQDLYGDVLMAQQEKLGHLAVIDLQTWIDWRFFLRFSKDGTPNRRYAFDKLGWLEFVQAKNLSAGDFVIFERYLKDPSHFYIDCVLPRKRWPRRVLDIVKTHSPADSSGKSGILRMMKSLEQAGHVAAAMPNESGKSLKSLFTLVITGEVSGECVDCLICLSLFPKGYEIERDTIFQLWVANGFLKELATWDAVEEEYVGVAYLYALECKGYVSCSREELGTGKLWHKLNDFTLSQEMSTRIAHLSRVGDDPPVKTTRPRHVTVRRLQR